ARRAAARAPASDGRAHAILGDALVALARTEEARAAFEEALRRDPGLPRAARGRRALGAAASP
ncbi:MAG: tetratricopeptide repeat protein, partial [Sandaracinaceae bacterium]